MISSSVLTQVQALIPEGLSLQLSFTGAPCAIDNRLAQLVCPAAGEALSGDAVLSLLPVYDDDCPAYVLSDKDAEPVAVPLADLKDQAFADGASLLVLPRPLLTKTRCQPQDLVDLMRLLMGPEGCPWDRKQTHQSLARFLVEEAYEAQDALAREDWPMLSDELGDVLLQVIFHALVGEKSDTFDLTDISSAIVHKLIRRHRNIFEPEAADNEGLSTWDKVKLAEKGQDADISHAQRMADAGRGLPPLWRAIKVKEIARQAGYEWRDAERALGKLREEVGELTQALHQPENIDDELADVLLSALDLARFLDKNPDHLVNLATDKFIKRFDHFEKLTKKAGKAIERLTDEEFLLYWSQSKGATNRGPA